MISREIKYKKILRRIHMKSTAECSRTVSKLDNLETQELEIYTGVYDKTGFP